jgi:hypothetical protein
MPGKPGNLTKAALVAAAALVTPAAAAEFDDPEWPCIQRKVEEISLFQMWSGPMPVGDWQQDRAIRDLAQRIAPRRVTLDEIEPQAREFADRFEGEERAERLGELFAAVLDNIQRERRLVFDGIGRYALRQASLSERVEEQQAELVRLNGAEEKDWDTIEEAEDRLAWDVRVYRERAQALSYVCESTVLLEQRAFAIGRLLTGMI